MQSKPFCNIVVTTITDIKLHDIPLKAVPTMEADKKEKLDSNYTDAGSKTKNGEDVNGRTNKGIDDVTKVNFIKETDKTSQKNIWSKQLSLLSKLLKKVHQKVVIAFTEGKITPDFSKYSFSKEMPLKLLLLEKSEVSGISRKVISETF